MAPDVHYGSPAVGQKVAIMVNLVPLLAEVAEKRLLCRMSVRVGVKTQLASGWSSDR